MPRVKLLFSDCAIEATLLETPVAKALYRRLPLTIDLVEWGEECYGAIACDLGVGMLQQEVAPGGIAYTQQGEYLCFFYGQRPAWAVELLGEVDNWQALKAAGKQSVRMEQL